MKVRVLVNEQELETIPFVREIIGGVVRGLITPLRGASAPRKVVVEVNFEDD
ncbi:MAG: hypothetical protein HY619_05330 [Thaumarchaeota archaeon]|nr:hypothetical protein [Nitrososphaerota archaeon]